MLKLYIIPPAAGVAYVDWKTVKIHLPSVGRSVYIDYNALYGLPLVNPFGLSVAKKKKKKVVENNGQL